MELEIVEEILLETLSFYEWQNIEKILISLNSKDIILIESITLDEMNLVLKKLMSRNMLEQKTVNKELLYRRTSKRKSFLKKLLSLGRG